MYGTLLRGESNHRELAEASFVRHARTEPRYELADLGGYPALVEDGSTAISGEIYDVDSELLARLDAFEEVPELYERKPIALAGEEVHGYVMPRTLADGAPRIMDGNWRTSAHQRRRS